MNTSERLVRNSTALLLGNASTKVFALFFYIYLCRKLSSDEVGVYNLLLTIMFYFTSLINFGFVPITIREIAKDKPRGAFIFSNILILRIFFMIISILILFILIFSKLYSNEINSVLYIMAILLFFSPFASSLESVFNAFEEIHLPQILGVLMSLLFSGLGIFLIYIGFQIKSIFVMQTLIAFIPLSVFYVLVSRMFFKPRFFFDKNYLKLLLKENMAFGLILFLQLLNSRVDIFMLSKIKGGLYLERGMVDQFLAVAIYANAFKILDNLSLVFNSIRNALFPMISGHFQNSFHVVVTTYRKTVKFVLVIYVAPAIIFFLFCSKSIISIMYPDIYFESYTVLMILVFAHCLRAFNVIIIPILFNSKEVWKVGIWSGFSLIINILANLFLVPRYSYMGAALGTLSSAIFLLIIKLILLKKSFNTTSIMVKIKKSWILILALTFGVIYPLYQINALVVTTLGILLYYFLIFKFKILEGEEMFLINIFKGLIKKGMRR